MAVQMLASLPSPLTLGAVFGLAIAAGWYALLATKSLPTRLVGLAAAVATGVAWAATFAHVRLADQLPEAFEGRDIEVIGIVASLPQHFERGVRFEFTPEQVLTAGATLPHRIQLAWYGGYAPDAAADNPVVHAGERWRLNLRVPAAT